MQTFDLKRFQEVLNQEIQKRHLKRATAEEYLRKIRTLKDSLPDQFSCEEVAERIGYLSERSGGTQMAKYMKAVKKYETGVLHQKGAYLYGPALTKLYEKQRPKKVVEIRHEISTYKRKINGISNEQMQMKLALRLQMKSGLRVFELAKLKKEHLHLLEDGTMEVQVFGGKGNQDRIVTVLQDSWLKEHLGEYLSSCEEGKPVFPDAKKIAEFARGLDIKTHELRKVYARLLYRNLRAAGKTMSQARKEVGVQLGHTGPRAGTVTNQYLGKEWEYGKNKKDKCKEKGTGTGHD